MTLVTNNTKHFSRVMRFARRHTRKALGRRGATRDERFHRLDKIR